MKTFLIFFSAILSFLFFSLQTVDAADFLSGKVIGLAGVFDVSNSFQLSGWVFFNKDGPNSCDTDYNSAIDINCGGDNTVENFPIPEDYGILITRPDKNTVLAKFSGSVWYYMSNGDKGWLDFNHDADIDGCTVFGGTPSVDCKAYLEINDSESWLVSGWAKALNSLSGWVDFRDSAIVNGSPYDFDVYVGAIDPLNNFIFDLRDKALWLKTSGGEIENAYFLSFNCLDGYNGINICASSENYKAQVDLSSEINQKPTVTINALMFNYCTKSGYPVVLPDEGKISLSWEYSDEEGDRQDRYLIHIESTDGQVIKDCESFQDLVSGGTGSASIITKISLDANCNISYGKTYDWTLSVKAQGGDTDWTEPIAGDRFTTPDEPYPYANFTPPDNPRKDANLTFADNSKCYQDGAMVSCANPPDPISGLSYLWEFNEGGDCPPPPSAKSTCPIQSGIGDVNHKYAVEGQFPAVLTVTQGGASCSYTVPIWVGTAFKTPSWIEIAP